jgi:2,3-bisphosphoglycerate-independent phosphoglycerate mutase
MEKTARPKPVALIILDGWGVAPESVGNAVARAETPVMDRLILNYPAMTISASSTEVGLNWGEMGNSEVGHLNIGAGRVYYQTMPRINKAVAEGGFADNEALKGAVEHAKEKGSRLHLIGLVSPGGVHSHQDHLFALLEMAAASGLKNVFVHAILDGRDTLLDSGIDFVTKTTEVMARLGTGRIASVSGRYYAMDRDNRWDRIEKAYRAIAEGVGEKSEDPLAAIRESYAKKVYDEEFVPTVITEKGRPLAVVGPNDAVIFWNFREDRARELTKAFVLPDFDKFGRVYQPEIFFVSMTEFEKGLPTHIAFPPDIITDCLAKVVSDHGLAQLHLAETEKYAHVTFFMNGQREEAFSGEDRVLVPSPRVASYDERPEMSEDEVTERAVSAIQENKHDLIIMNYAAPDMVGHTGDLDATIRACAFTDECVGRVVDAVLAMGGVALITADHGNAEEVRNLQTGGIDKEHSTSPVPFIIVGKEYEGMNMGLPEGMGADLTLVPPVGVLGDVAPTILKIMGLPQPAEMTGRPLI